MASEGSWHAAEAWFETFGGFAFAREYDIERKFRESRLYMVAPVTNNMVLNYISHQVLGLPRS